MQVAVELRTAATAAWSKESLEGRLKALLPDMQGEDFFEMSSELSIQAGKVEHKNSAPAWKGLVFHTSDRRETVQFRNDTFVMTRAAPYPGWETFVASLKKRWEIHKEISGAQFVTRFGLRFINRIAMGTKACDIDDFIHCGPKDYPSQKLLVVNFLHREQMLEPSENYFVQVIRASNNREVTGSQPTVEYGITVDIDVFTQKQWSTTEGLDDHLTAMRDLKNKVFFGSITEKARMGLL